MTDDATQMPNAPEGEESETQRKLILKTALELVAEHGIAGASLRKLAARVGMSQPSLYHYFKSKDALIDEVAEMGALHMVESVHLDGLGSASLEELPRRVKDDIFRLWEGNQHALYTKFLFVVAIESPRHQPILRRVFRERLEQAPSQELALLFQKNPALAHHLFESLTMLARAMGLCLIEERLLFGLEEPSERTRAHADFVADLVAESLKKFELSHSPPSESE